jgi:hypothetical protein
VAAAPQHAAHLGQDRGGLVQRHMEQGGAAPDPVQAPAGHRQAPQAALATGFP